MDYTPPQQPGESGVRLEVLVFGGQLHFLRDKRLEDSEYPVCRSIIASVQGQLSRLIDV